MPLIWAPALIFVLTFMIASLSAAKVFVGVLARLA
jgi:hypothetical protein